MAQNVLNLPTIDFSLASWQAQINANFTAVKQWLENSPLELYDVDIDGGGSHPSPVTYPHSLYFAKTGGFWDLWFTETVAGTNFKIERSTVALKTITNGTGSPYALTSNEAGNWFINTGATALVQANLPAVIPIATNYYPIYRFIVIDPDGFRIKANTGHTIRLLATVSASAGHVQSIVAGDVIQIMGISSTEWLAVATVGLGWMVT